MEIKVVLKLVTRRNHSFIEIDVSALHLKTLLYLEHSEERATH